MLQVSDKFKKGCNSDSLKYREYIIIDGKQVDIKGNLSATAYKDTTFFGTFNMKMLTFQTENDINYKKKEFIYYKEVDGESVKIGTFIVTEVKDSDTFEQVNVTAYDYGLKFANPYTTKLDYSSGKITMFNVIQEICTNCGVELENTTLPNGSFIVDSNQFINDEQFGDVVAIVSLDNGMFATINENDKLEFIFTKVTIGNETNLSTEADEKLLTENDNFIIVNDLEVIEDYIDLDDKRDTQPITSVLVATSKDLESAGAVRKDQDLINKYGEHWLKIYDYAFAYSSEKCEQLVDAIFNQVRGFGYSSFESNYSFKPYLQLGDKIKFKNKNGELVKSVVLRIESNYDDITLSAPSIINASVEYDLPQTAEEIAQRASIEVNKANAEIKLKVNKDDLISEINLSPETIELKGNRVVIDSTNFKVNETGNMTCTEANLNSVNVSGGSIILYSANMEDQTFKIVNPNDTNFIEFNSFYGRMGADGENKIILQAHSGAIRCVTLVQTSLKKDKKNFEKFENALQELDKINIYKYNLKNEEDNSKKHLGFVIGDDFKYSELVTSQDNKGVDIYSFTSLCFQMIKEQQEQIEELKKEVQKLKGVDNNG